MMVYTHAQVAHDLKSPLAALRALAQDLGEVSNEKRHILQMIVDRIQYITQDVMQPQSLGHAFPKLMDTQFTSDQTASSKTKIAALVDEILAEKKIVFQKFKELQFQVTIEAELRHFVVLAEPNEMRRILSNLIDNAIEAMDQWGTVHITMQKNNSSIKVQIKDHGKGISPEILPLLGNRGATFNKVGGSGLGLYHAKTQLAQWGGQLTIDSELNQGTVVSIFVPCELNPGLHA